MRTVARTGTRVGNIIHKDGYRLKVLQVHNSTNLRRGWVWVTVKPVGA